MDSNLHRKYCLLAILCIAYSAGNVYSNPVVSTRQGTIVGKKLSFDAPELQLKTSIDAFLGIPYAEPPVGPLRFKPPIPKTWSGELQATTVGNRCPQPVDHSIPVVYDGPFDEDCLFLDVFVPTRKPKNAAVMIWLHGGGYFIGAGLVEAIHPSPLVAIGDVIVVTVNYRLGAFGFLSTEDSEAPGNVGMLDQIEAMKWVRDNIADFGGSPDRVTIFGMSAGGSSISLQTLSPLSRGLFSGAIMQSGTAVAPWAYLRTPGSYRKKAFHIGFLLGCQQASSEELIQCLQDIPAIDIVKATPQNNNRLENDNDMLFFGPTIDSHFLLDHPAELLAKGLVHDNINAIVGETADDGMFFILINFFSQQRPHINAETFYSYLKDIAMSDSLIESVIKTFYLENHGFDYSDRNYLDDLNKILTDVHFVCSGNMVTEALAKAGRQVYRYRLNHVSSMTFFNTTWEGAIHGTDLLFIFGTHFNKGNDIRLTEEEVDMTVKVIRYWSNFAKSGNPTLAMASVEDELTSRERHSEWPQFTIDEPAFKDLSLSMHNGNALKAKECALWNDVIPRLNILIDDLKRCKSERHWSRETTCGADETSCDGNEMDETTEKQHP
ncbi:acetylcholinesterase-like [Amphiura filiformis]|uniref:acetylcholinesterase-like n=1 Tax=Amphiura filiformis TaxID=82378 RepID=UPI003B220E1A